MPRKPFPAGRLVGLSNDTNRPPVSGLDDIYGHLLDSIVDQRLAPGTKLNELTLCEIFDVGRRHVAQVLTRLAHDGLVLLQPNRGAFVAAPDVDEAHAIFDARRLIECQIVRRIARAADPAALERLRANVAEEAEHRRRSRLREAVRTSGAFHILLGEMSGNPILSDLVRQLVARTSLVASLYENQESMACWHDDHAGFLDLLAAGEADGAAALMARHLTAVEASLDFERRSASVPDLRRIYAPPAG